jgi:hypothetical protein
VLSRFSPPLLWQLDADARQTMHVTPGHIVRCRTNWTPENSLTVDALARELLELYWKRAIQHHQNTFQNTSRHLTTPSLPSRQGLVPAWLDNVMCELRSASGEQHRNIIDHCRL